MSGMMRGIVDALARGVAALVDSDGKLQRLQVRLTAGEVKDGVEHFEPYGYTSCPFPGAEALIGFVGGDRSHGIAVVVGDRRYRLAGLKGGEVALYTDEGDTLVFKRNRTIELTTQTFVVNASKAISLNAGERIDLNAPEISGNGNVAVSGGLDVEGDADVGGALRNKAVDVGEAHVHKENDVGGFTDPVAR